MLGAVLTVVLYAVVAAKKTAKAAGQRDQT
jgi:hypothetical protein